jgi:Spy/CpxP family protein refolding chaperone
MSFLRHKGVWVLLIASLAFNIGLASTFGVRAYQNFRPPCEPDGPGGPPRGDHGLMAERLGLTPQQAEQLSEIKRKFMDQADQLHEEREQAHQDLADLIAADQPDEGAIAAQIKVLTDLMGEMNVELAHHFLEIKALLTPEQNAAFNEMIRDRHTRGGGPGHFGRRGGPRGRMRGHGGRHGQWQQDQDQAPQNSPNQDQ